MIFTASTWHCLNMASPFWENNSENNEGSGFVAFRTTTSFLLSDKLTSSKDREVQ